MHDMEFYTSRAYDVLENTWSPAQKSARQTVKSSEPTWIDGAGREIPLREMETSHIFNCINLLDERRGRLAETATYYDEESNLVVERQLQLWDDSIKAFFKELRRRGEKKGDV